MEEDDGDMPARSRPESTAPTGPAMVQCEVGSFSSFHLLIVLSPSPNFTICHTLYQPLSLYFLCCDCWTRVTGTNLCYVGEFLGKVKNNELRMEFLLWRRE